MTDRGLQIDIGGTVQGVGYRPWVFQVARRLGVSGRVWNHSAGVTVEVHGEADAVERFVHVLETETPPAARVVSVTCTPIAFQPTPSFTIGESVPDGAIRVSIPADLAPCDDCLREMADPADRRYRYPFINCTNCGPRYSIVWGAPYDRPKTSMAGFRMCGRCQREYDDPADRRFHAQPNACPDCGPRLIAVSPQGEELLNSDPVAFAARTIRAGMIVALKGAGGFHLACDATSAQAVARLRQRKGREAKPFAIMVATLEAAEKLAFLDDHERALLVSTERPIVLARSRDDAELPLIGLFLPGTPLHHLLLRETGIPLIMTSGNITDEPMVSTNLTALGQLAGIADLFLMHDRDIVTRVDDSIVRIIGGEPVLLRRARGYVPRAIHLKHAFREPVLACGAHLKNTFCIATGDSAFPGPHIGDLESVATLRAYESGIQRMKEFLGVEPLVLAHDLHPDYYSTRYAEAQEGVRRVAVQHHHAHIASVMGEHGLDGPVVGIAYDGTGFGTDGTLWGGEILVARYHAFERFATFRPIPLAGGEKAIEEPWRIALALLDEAYSGQTPLASIPLFGAIDASSIAVVRQMIARNFNTTPARGIGRYFDAIGAIVLGMGRASYEGEVAFRLNMIADPGERGRYPIVVREGIAPWEVDPRTIVRSVVDDLRAGCPAATVSARFHNTLAAVTVELARAALAVHGPIPVVLSGGCFQNARLAESVIDGLRQDTTVFMNREVPPGDGGISLGQALVADAQLRREMAAPASGSVEVSQCV